jgi:putative ABC transport system ATP-binding protein
VMVDSGAQGGIATASALPAVVVEDLEVRFGETVALARLSLAVAQGEMVALMGVSGSGKSTLLNSVAGLQPPTSGRVLVGGKDVWAASARERTAARLRRVGLVFQDSDLIPELSLLENVALPMEIAGSRRSEALERALVILTAVGLDEATVGRRSGAVSGGQQQRAAVARALAHEPTVVLADEPTGALDANSRKRVVEVFREATERGAAAIIATHDPEIADSSDRVLHLRDGALR